MRGNSLGVVEPAIFLLLGYPGTGKYTVAQALAAQLTESGVVTKIIDNHHINNPIFAVLNTDGITPLPDAVWDHVRQVRQAVLGAIEECAPPDFAFIFTNYIHAQEFAADPDVAAYLQRLERLAERRHTRLNVVSLTCELEELCQRIVRSDRAERLKSISADWLRAESERHAIYAPAGPNALTLDITRMPPAVAAQRILGHFGASQTAS